LIDEQQVSDTNPLFELAKIPCTPWLELYPVQHTSPHRTLRTYTKRSASCTIDIDFVQINPLLPHILINAFPKFIYSYAAASSHLNFYIF